MGGHPISIEAWASAHRLAGRHHFGSDIRGIEMLWGERQGCDILRHFKNTIHEGGAPMSQSFDASRSLAALEQDNTIIAVIEMSKAKWLVAALVPGLKRQPLKKLDVDAPALLKLLQRWRDEAGRAGHPIKRIAVAYEAAGDGFWLVRWLRAHDIEAYAIHPASVAV
ncbi:hypothetical protein X773_33215 [Mesorhizobium sp. LSJC285A00]|nr:hypothetical protein X773_33215 [Mesorhizobium sp. LSJC285A00]